MFVDLHMHSCLSPCADDDMTPANICGMAHIKGLQAIAVTDHNTARNLPYVKEAADYYGLILLPGMEITTKEEGISVLESPLTAYEICARLAAKGLPGK